jgi:hypothetical protein
MTELDTATITAAITRLIATGASEQALLAAVAYLFPDLSPAELPAAPREAQAAAARQATRRHRRGDHARVRQYAWQHRGWTRPRSDRRTTASRSGAAQASGVTARFHAGENDAIRAGGTAAREFHLAPRSSTRGLALTHRAHSIDGKPHLLRDNSSRAMPRSRAEERAQEHHNERE